jgi:hypothetical protein
MDIGSEFNAACLMDKEGNVFGRYPKIYNSRKGFDYFHTMVEQTKRKHKLTHVFIGMEPTGHYWRKIAFFAKEKGYEVRFVRTTAVKHQRELDESSSAKSDIKDAFTIGNITREGKYIDTWMQAQFDEKKVEPNSGLGKAFTYMFKHWEPLTLFLRVPGAPLDNNIGEQSLKMVIRHRKNSLFYRTLHGDYIGDLFMSLIHTCRLSKVNPLHYLVALQRHSHEVFKNPHAWLPWNYEVAVAELPP